MDSRLTLLPGGALVADGLTDLAHGLESVSALVVAIGAPRLGALGIEVPTGSPANPEEKLYALLARQGSDSAHSRYNGLIRRLVSFERALACARL